MADRTEHPQPPLTLAQFARIEAVVDAVIDTPHLFTAAEWDIASALEGHTERYRNDWPLSETIWQAIASIEEKIAKEETQPVGRSPEGEG